MALFPRRPSGPATPPDPVFGYWDRPTADAFRGLVRTAFAETGIEVEVYADHVVDSGGTQFGLGNLAATCHNDERGRRAWPELIGQHVRSLTAGMAAPSPWDSLSRDQVFQSTYCRVMATDGVLPTMTYASELAPGLSVALNLDLPETVLYFTDDHVARFGLDALRRTGTANLLDVAFDEHEVLEQNGGRVEVLLGESLFTASLLLILDEAVRRIGLRIDPRIGAFVAVPNRHQLDVHVPHDTSAVPSLQLLAGFAAAGFDDAAGPVTPSVYWWRPDAVERISVRDDDGIRIEVGPELGEILTRFGAL